MRACQDLTSEDRITTGHWDGQATVQDQQDQGVEESPGCSDGPCWLPCQLPDYGLLGHCWIFGLEQKPASEYGSSRGPSGF